MITYKGKILTKTADKTAGKNRSDVDGFYIDENGQEYFIKKPEDKKELFTELFAGLLLREFMKRKLIDPVYFDSLICADIIQFNDGSYGLIQPKVSFKVLYEIIGTGYKTSDKEGKKSSDRDPLLEMIAGPSYYPTLTQQGQYYGLSIALMFSLLLGDNSVHSGNVVVIDKIFADNLLKLFARIDWGAAFRYFAEPKNNVDVLKPYEYQKGWFNYTWFTKGYLANYKYIYGLFTAIAAKATELVNEMANVSMQDIVNAALSQIPADMLDKDTQKELAKYMAIPSFEHASFGLEGDYTAVAETFSAVLNERLAKITLLKEPVKPAESSAVHSEVVPSSSVYQSFVGVSALHKQLHSPIAVTINSECMLPEQFEFLLAISQTARPLDCSQIDFTKLSQQFNHYVNLLARQTDVFNLWRHSPDSNVNIFTPYFHGTTKATLGSAFVAQYRESTIIRRLFTLQEDSFVAFGAYQNAVQEYTRDPLHKDSLWLKIEAVLRDSYAIINELRLIQNTQRSTDSGINNPENIDQYIRNLKNYLTAFSTSKAILDNFLARNLVEIGVAANILESPVFYPIPDAELFEMSGEQLVTICFEELYTENPSQLVVRIIKNDALWDRLLRSYSEETFGKRADMPQSKIDRLKYWHHHFSKFWIHKNNFHLATSLEEKQAEYHQASTHIQALPPSFLADKEVELAYKGTARVLALWQSHNQNYLSKERRFLTERSNAAYEGLLQAFNELPADLQQHYQHKIQAYEKETLFRQKLALHKQQKSFNQAEIIFDELNIAFNGLDEALKSVYRGEFTIRQAVMPNWQLQQTYLREKYSFEKSQTPQEKTAAFPKLNLAFSALPDDIKTEYREQIGNYSKETDYLRLLITHQKQNTIANSRTSFPPLDTAFTSLSTEQRNQYQQSFATLESQNQCYEILLNNRILKSSSNIQETNQTLQRLQNTGKLKTAALNDEKLWNAIAKCQRNEDFSTELIQDLLTIQKFYQDRVLPENDKEFSEDYIQSLDNFYQRALVIRLSKKAIKTQAAEIIDAAHQEFQHRDRAVRICADVLMLVSILFFGLGIAIMAARYATNNTLFFSTAATKREVLLTSEWMTSLADLPDEGKTEQPSRLFNQPTAASAA